jgi:hypothetical protein
MSTPQILYRSLDPNGDPEWGQSQGNFLADVDAVGQAILTRLRLFEGEWWANQLDGVPYWQKILGFSGANGNTQAISLILQANILGAPFVTGITNAQASYDPGARQFSFYASVQTQFGTLTVTYNTPSVPPQGLPQ